jgi:hypothetical protein
MGIQKWTTVILAATILVTPSAFAQISIARAPRPAIVAPSAPALETPQQAFDRLPEAAQQTVVTLAAQEPLSDMQLSPATAQALARLAANEDAADIEALAIIVMMLAARQAEDDLREMMIEMSETERCSREAASVTDPTTPADSVQTGAPTNSTLLTPQRLHPRPEANRRPLPNMSAAVRVRAPAQQTPDSQCAPEEEQLRMQILMDRRARANEMLNEILRRQSASEGQVIQNIK